MTDQPMQRIAGDKDPDAPEGVDEGDDRELLGNFFKGEEGVRFVVAVVRQHRCFPFYLLVQQFGS